MTSKNKISLQKTKNVYPDAAKLTNCRPKNGLADRITTLLGRWYYWAIIYSWKDFYCEGFNARNSMAFHLKKKK